MTPKNFQIDCLDGELATRLAATEFRRIITMRETPNFLLALAEYGALIPDYFTNNVILNKVVTEAWRFEMLVYCLYLHDTRRDDDARSGLTLANLQKLCSEQNCSSPGRVFAILGIMRLGGYLKRLKTTDDKRVVRLEPSEAFVKVVEGWNNRLFRIIDAIIPDDNLTSCHDNHPRFGWVMRRRGAEGLIAGWRLLPPFPEVNHFVTKDGGWMLLLTCVSQSLAMGEWRQIVPLSLDLQAFGARFGVSRSHLRRLLESAYAAGLLDAPPKNGSFILLSEKLVASFLACMASELSYYRSHALAAKIELGLSTVLVD